MTDFTTPCLKSLLNAFLSKGYEFYTVSDYIHSKILSPKLVLLRHDVENKYDNALRFAETEHSLGIKGTFYFRFVEKSFNSVVIHKIAQLGHEIGYHYDDFSKSNGNYQTAILRFKENLELLRQIAPVQTICMEGDPISKYSNLDLWKKYNFCDYGIVSEAYLSVDFDEINYFTETGRCWDGHNYNLRDKVPANHIAKGIPGKTDPTDNPEQNFRNISLYHSTFDIMNAIGNNDFPSKVMMTFHPQRWNDNLLDWTIELVFQNMKNILKYLLVKGRK